MPEAGRAISEVLGYALVFGVVLTTVTVVTVGGVGQLEDARNAEQVNNAERALELMAHNIDDVALRGSPSRATEISLADAQIRVADPVEFEFRGDFTNGTIAFNESYSVWPVTYQTDRGDTALTYVGGAVFRVEQQGGVVVREPPIVASNDRILVPLLLTRSDGAQSRGDGTIRVRVEHGNTDLLVSDNRGNHSRFFMNVTSPRADIWADELGQYDGFTCTLDTSGSVDRTWCEATASPFEQLHVSLIKMDAELAT